MSKANADDLERSFSKLINMKEEMGIYSILDLKKINFSVRQGIINETVFFVKDISEAEIDAGFIAEEIKKIIDISSTKNAVGILDDTIYLISYAAYEDETEFIRGDTLLHDFYIRNKRYIDHHACKNYNIMSFEYNPDYYLVGSIELQDRDSGVSLNSLHIIWDVIDEYIRINHITTSTKDVVDALIKQYIYALVHNISDFHSRNWALLHKEKTLQVYPKFDDEFLDKLFYRSDDGLNFFDMRLYDGDEPLASVEQLIRFIRISGGDYLDDTINMLETLLEVGAEEIVLRSEKNMGKEIKFKKAFIKNYTKRLNVIKKILTEMKQEYNQEHKLII